MCSSFQNIDLSSEYGYRDIGDLVAERPNQSDLEKYVGHGEIKIPHPLPKDVSSRRFPVSICVDTTKNDEGVPRDRLMWSPSKQALYCLPCRLFHSCSSHGERPVLASTEGWGPSRCWKKTV